MILEFENFSIFSDYSKRMNQLIDRIHRFVTYEQNKKAIDSASNEKLIKALNQVPIRLTKVRWDR